MKLEVPHLRIMRGEAADLSPSASKLLLILIACQDQFSHTITWSKTSLSQITGLPCRSIYRSLAELAQGNWIKRNHQLIQIVNTSIVTPQSLHTSLPDTTGTQTANTTDTTGSLPDTTGTQTAKAVAHDQDQEDLKDHPDSDFLSGITLKIAEYYGFTPGKYRQLWTLLRGKDHNKIRAIFEVMQRQTIHDPLAYLITSLGTNGGSQQTFQNFLESLPD